MDKIRRTAFFLLCLMPILLAVTRAGADIASCLIGALLLFSSTLRKEWSWSKSAEMRVLELLWLFMMASAFLTPFSHKEAFITSLLWGRFVLLYAAARYWLLTDRQSLTLAGKIAAITLLAVAVDAGWQYITGTSLTGRPIHGDRLTGPLGTPNVGIFLLKVGMPVAGVILFKLAEAGRRRGLWLSGAAIVYVLTIIILSGERSSVVLMLAGIGAAGLTLFASRPRLRLPVFFGGAGIIALLALLIVTQPTVQNRAEEFTQQLGNFWHTYYGQMYIAAFDLGMAHPLTGTGAREFFPACNSIMRTTGVTYCDIHPHNIYMEWLAAGGIPALLLFALAMACFARQLARGAVFSDANVWLSAFAFGGYAVLAFPFAVMESGFSNWSGTLTWYSMGLVMSLYHMRKPHG